MILGAVQHVGSVDELVTRTSNSQLRLGVSQNNFTPESQPSNKNYKHNHTQTEINTQTRFYQHILCVAGHGCEVELVFGPEDHVSRPDF